MKMRIMKLIEWMIKKLILKLKSLSAILKFFS
jgi:hypothetical protein